MKKVVVAESSPTIKSVADSLLRQSGFDVICTSDGLQAWEVISAEKPDLILAGLGLSGISGLELCRQVTSNKITGGIPVVLMLGANDAIREEEIVASGARGRLKKPFSPKDLLEIANKLAGQSQNLEARSGAAATKPIEAKFITQVASTQHLQKKQETYNLEWLDLSESTSSKNIAKVASFDISNDDQTLIIEEDQYGLASPIIEEKEERAEQPASDGTQEKDEDYDWFVGEMKREVAAKTAETSAVDMSPRQAAKPADDSEATPDMSFDDIRPSEGSGKSRTQTEEAHSDKKTSTFRGAPTFSLSEGHAAAGVRQPSGQPSVGHLSEAEIGRIADQVASKLAGILATRIDKNLILDAIRAELNP
jgi:CheY-like chemotaxis protein